MADLNLNPIGATLANLAAANAAPNFELQFSRIQNTIIRRVNDEISRVTVGNASKRHEIDALRRKGLKLADSLPLLKAYREGNENNLGQLQKLIEETATLATSLGADDTVDAAEVAAFNAQRDAVVELLTNLPVYIHPDVNDGRVIQFLKEQVDALNALDPVVGSLSGDAENIAATEAVSTLQNKLGDALTVTQNTVTVTLGLEQGIEKKQTEILADFTELTQVEAARQENEINNIKAEYANVLTAISLTFEANQNVLQGLNQFLTPFVPEPGSILNIFS